jgi:threonine dehydrogenase-like Zn-dependent dehydrogenase
MTVIRIKAGNIFPITSKKSFGINFSKIPIGPQPRLGMRRTNSDREDQELKVIAAKEGSVVILDMEDPAPMEGHLRIRTEYSAISPGTELTMIRRSTANPAALGYSAVGIVESVGAGVTGWKVGARAACYGAPYVHHAELLSVPANLATPVPEWVAPEEAAFAGLGAIAIHALRTADLRFGESVAVVGLGILGNLIAQIANVSSFRTAGLDLSEARAALLRRCGALDVWSSQNEFEAHTDKVTGGLGFDSILLCASGKGEQLFNDAFKLLRDRGRIVIVGDVSAEFSRAAMFAKEAQVLISRAGGPGRYDLQYERENKDYPIGYVRWTEGRNTAEYVRLLAAKRITVEPLITGVYPPERAKEAYGQHGTPTAAVGTCFGWGHRDGYSDFPK